MIVASDVTVKYLQAQESLDELAKSFGVTKQTLFNIRDGERVSSEMIERLLKSTGFAFDAAFEFKES